MSERAMRGRSAGSAGLRPALMVVVLLAATHLCSADAAMPKVESGTLQTVAVTGTFARTMSDLIARADGPAWVGYSVPAVAGERTICCGNWRGCCSGTCHLEKERGTNIMDMSDDEEVILEAGGSVVILLRIDGSGKGGSVTKIRAASPECGLNAGSRPFHWLTGVEPSQSIAWLSSRLDAGRPRNDGVSHDDTGEAIMAIALHHDAGADAALEKLAAKGRSREEREQATFWMGNLRGRRGYETLRRMLREEGDSEIKEKVIFALSQSPVPEATDALIDTARNDDDSEVRGEALFWLAQMAAERADAAIADAIENDPETDVKKKAVFALSQLPSERGVPLLINVARTHRNPAIRKEAMFWLGQSGDPRALEYFEEILETPSRKGV